MWEVTLKQDATITEDNQAGVLSSRCLLCGTTESYEAFLVYRYVAGLGAGMMVAFMYATISASENPDREFAYAMALQVFVGALCLSGASYLWMTWGAGFVFIMCGLVALVLLSRFRVVG